MIFVRSVSEVARHEVNASAAASTARSTSAADANGTRRRSTRPVEGSKTSPVRADEPPRACRRSSARRAVLPRRSWLPVSPRPVQVRYTECMATVEINGMKIAYEIVGDGRPWIVTPGGRFTKESPGVRELAIGAGRARSASPDLGPAEHGRVRHLLRAARRSRRCRPTRLAGLLRRRSTSPPRSSSAAPAVHGFRCSRRRGIPTSRRSSRSGGYRGDPSGC